MLHSYLSLIFQFTLSSYAFFVPTTSNFVRVDKSFVLSITPATLSYAFIIVLRMLLTTSYFISSPYIFIWLITFVTLVEIIDVFYKPYTQISKISTQAWNSFIKLSHASFDEVVVTILGKMVPSQFSEEYLTHSGLWWSPSWTK